MSQSYLKEKAATLNAQIMARHKDETPHLDNVISDQTGQYDLRFILWRQFCKDKNIPVETLPSQLDDDLKEEWEALKSSRLRSAK